MNTTSPLSIPSRFLFSIPWDSVVQLNQAACDRSPGTAHGLNSESGTDVSQLWETMRPKEMTVLELLDFLHLCHRKAPFLNFNGNVFAEIGRQLLGVSLLGMPVTRIGAATSLAAHYVAGVLDQAPAFEGIRALLHTGVLKPGDLVTTLKFSARGRVTRILADGRVAWARDGRKTELLASPESLIKIEPGQQLPQLG